MRKTLEIIGLVLGIVASLLAIIAFLSGRASLPAFISTSPVSTPIAVSSSSPTPTTIAPSASDEAQMGNLFGIYFILMFIISSALLAPAWLLKGRRFSCENMIIVSIVGIVAPILLPSIIIITAMFALIEIAFKDQIIAFLLAIVISIPVCILIMRYINRWIRSLYNKS